ncbi:MAG: hypothetical protein JSV05_07240 [Candidatus Bathyarchaeota archaeon]|nr:MAG: hypothetical protein JSV05_07240 [Candidatus Bathyarchaeota archaeon]
MKLKILPGALLAICIFTTVIFIPTAISADNLLRTDFKKESFAKIVDYFDYARALALLGGLPRPANFWHAYVYMTYVNKMGLQMLYSGLCNISLADLVYLTIPMQTLLLHYKTETNNRDALVASSFLMLMGFNDTTQSVYQNSPDRNDTLWASFSLGLNLNQLFPNATFPSLSSQCEIFALTSSNDGLTWKWGMRYTNLTALWITTYVTDKNETDTSRPFGLATYDELTFNYTLSIDPNTHTATVSQDHVIGRMRDLWIFWGWLGVPLYNHYNSTGCYRYGVEVSNQTIYKFLLKNHVKMSIVDFQTSILLDRETYSTSADGQNVTDDEVLVSDSSISTYADDGEKISNTNFAVKDTYALYNYTVDDSENTSQDYTAIARTAQIHGYARNRNLFNFHGNFARYLPLILVYMYPDLYDRAKDTIANMTRADYLCLISYPNYSGYKIEHDPLQTIYFAPTVGTGIGGLIVFGTLACIIVVVLVMVLKRRGSKKPLETTTPQPSPFSSTVT